MSLLTTGLIHQFHMTPSYWFIYSVSVFTTYLWSYRQSAGTRHRKCPNARALLTWPSASIASRFGWFRWFSKSKPSKSAVKWSSNSFALPRSSMSCPTITVYLPSSRPCPIRPSIDWRIHGRVCRLRSASALNHLSSMRPIKTAASCCIRYFKKLRYF